LRPSPRRRPAARLAGDQSELNASLGPALESIMEDERIAQRWLFTTADVREGVTAFIEKRAARFTGERAAPHRSHARGGPGRPRAPDDAGREPGARAAGADEPAPPAHGARARDRDHRA